MSILTDATRSNKAKEAAREILNIVKGFSFRDCRDAINSATEHLEYAMKEEVFCNTT